MTESRSVFAVFLSLTYTGCAIHPQTEDFSRSMLPDIVYHIRCEAKHALLKTVPDPQDRIIRKSAVTYKFEFVMTENNDLTSEGKVVIPISLGSFSIGWDAGAEKQRKATQEVQFTDVFARLVSLPCGAEYERRNFRYPITGNIGLVEVFENYAVIASEKPGSDLSNFSDVVEFTTTIHAAVTPSVDLTPKVGRKIMAEFNVEGKRIDLHRLTLGFAQKKTLEQLAADRRIAARALEKELKLLRLKRQIPLQVQVVDENGKIIEPGAGGSAFNKDDRKSPGKQALPQIEQSDILPELESDQDLIDRSDRNLRRNESIRIEREILEQIDR